ncbi:hypothetical protein WA026_022660 [Henosepilachna vigintioctopunctata]|uniref:Uncharacterized protein n=1 Tax=Henosepilachna vigintioctopunctata TaxID=420089 RepID=A0AAW1U7R8_9CUCU
MEMCSEIHETSSAKNLEKQHTNLQLTPVVQQIEACLNSRHDGDANPLTPGHFSIGRPIESPLGAITDTGFTRGFHLER